ncbi:hypothetical protein RI367_001701 [Sorochytrium milnesiophthora]
MLQDPQCSTAVAAVNGDGHNSQEEVPSPVATTATISTATASPTAAANGSLAPTPPSPAGPVDHGKQQPRLPRNDEEREALSQFTELFQNEYRSKALGLVDNDDSLPCVCSYEPGVSKPRDACGDGSGCINRSLFIECLSGECPSGEFCRNRRFQNKEYAKVEVFKTEKKGFGLRALEDLKPDTFVMEYIGEVMPYTQFLKRAQQYHKGGNKHFYFMSLQKGEVGNRLRIGIFTIQAVSAGTELAFDYKFERYGQQAQACYCGEPNCKGYIGTKGKGDAGNATGLHESDMQDDDDESNLISTAPRKKREKKPKTEGFVGKEEITEAVRIMYRCKPDKMKEMVKRLLLTAEDGLTEFIRMHGIIIVKMIIRNMASDQELVHMAFKLLQMLPFKIRNRIEETKLDAMIETMADNADPFVAETSRQLLEKWQTLQVVYKIPKMQKSAEDVLERPKSPTEDRKRRHIEHDMYRQHDMAAEEQEQSKRAKPSDSHDDRRGNGHSRFNSYRPGRSGHSSSSAASSMSGSSFRGSWPYGNGDAGAGMAPGPQQPPFLPPLLPMLPPPLPPNWQCVFGDEGQMCFVNAVTGKVQQEYPDERPSMVEGISEDTLLDVVAQAQAAVAAKAAQEAEAEKERAARSEAERKQRQQEDRERRRQRELRKEQERQDRHKALLEEREKKERMLKEKAERKHQHRHRDRPHRTHVTKRDDDSGTITPETLDSSAHSPTHQPPNDDGDDLGASRSLLSSSVASTLADSSSPSTSTPTMATTAATAKPTSAEPAKSEQQLDPAAQAIFNSAPMKSLRSHISDIVIKKLSKYKTSMSSDNFKHHARQMTHRVMQKESRRYQRPEDVPKSMDEGTRTRVVQYFSHYVQKQKLVVATTKS